MNQEERERLRSLIDGAVREQVENEGGPKCAGCGTPHDCRTAGCRTCTNRHFRWRTRKPRSDRGCRAALDYCIECGVDYDERTKGCKVCNQRHRKRLDKLEKVC